MGYVGSLLTGRNLGLDRRITQAESFFCRRRACFVIQRSREFFKWFVQAAGKTHLPQWRPFITHFELRLEESKVIVRILDSLRWCFAAVPLTTLKLR